MFMYKNVEAKVLQTIQYFSFFKYPPTFAEIYTFLRKKTSKKRLASILEKMEKKKLVRKHFSLKPSSLDTQRYTLGEYNKKIKDQRSKIKDWSKREEYSRKKIKKIQLFLKILSLFPQIQLVGLSGTVAMMNADEKDDIDLFIITAKNRLFTGRFIAILLAIILGLKRQREDPRFTFHVLRHKDKVCLNLFFDESDLHVPKHKQTKYVAHEVLQMKPLIVKNDIYQRFLAANEWVSRLFPNAVLLISKSQFPISKQISNIRIPIPNFLTKAIEKILKSLQLYFINKHRTTEIITDTQLWFHPEDFEFKLHGLTRMKKRINID